MNYQDQLQRTVFIPTPPQRIISTVPSHTELLYDLGLEKQIVGITRFCIFPKSARKTKKIIGGTKNLNLDRIRQLKPDLIFADKEENTKEQIEEISKEFPVWVSTIKTIPAALWMFKQIGLITDRRILSEKMILAIQTAFTKIDSSKQKVSVAYFIWQKPMMVAASDTFIHEMLSKTGLTNVFADKSRYPSLSEIDLKKANPSLILLSSEPYLFQEKHIAYFKQLVPDAKVMLVDGTYFSWHGSRILQAADYLEAMQKLFIPPY